MDNAVKKRAETLAEEWCQAVEILVEKKFEKSTI